MTGLASPSPRREVHPPRSLSIVIPTFNEAARLPGTLPEVVEILADLDAELIVVDDGSVDGSSSVVSEFLGPRVHVVRLEQHRGKGAAVREGAMLAGGRQVMFMDADLATD